MDVQSFNVQWNLLRLQKMHILLCQVRWTENSQTKIVEQSDNNSILVHSSSPKRLILQTIPKQDRASFITIAEKITSLWHSRLQVKNSLVPTTKKLITTILPEFKGCYVLTGEGRTLTGLAEAEIFEMNSVTKCLQICKDGGFPFAEVQGE